MDTIKELIKFFIKAAFAFFLGALVWWLVSLMYPEISMKNLASKVAISSSSSEGWLPSPRKYSLAVKNATGPTVVTGAENSKQPLKAIYNSNTNRYEYTTYKYSDYTNTPQTNEIKVTETVTSPPAIPARAPQSSIEERVLTIRNLSVYEGGHVYTGLQFVGEARSTMFKEGKFPIIVVDQNGRMVGVSAAVATTDWTVPGWTRFETRISYVLPKNMPCTMVFEEALTSNEKINRQPLRIPIRVMCN